MADPPTYQIRPLRREEIEAFREGQLYLASEYERLASINLSFKEEHMRCVHKQKAFAARALARELLSIMEAKPQISSSVDRHQQTGAARDVIIEQPIVVSVQSLVDDHDSALTAIMAQMKERADLRRQSTMEARCPELWRNGKHEVYVADDKQFCRACGIDLGPFPPATDDARAANGSRESSTEEGSA